MPPLQPAGAAPLAGCGMTDVSNDIKGGAQTIGVTARTPAERHRAGLAAAGWALTQPDSPGALRDVLDALGIAPGGAP